MKLDPTQLTETQVYNFMMGSILPRPIAWISTVDAVGRVNLAPFSYFMGVCCVPMTVMFCPVFGSEARPKKDTLLNIGEVPEFVVNLATDLNIDAVNMCGAPLPKGESEFELAGVTAVGSCIVKPPRVAQAPIAFECRVREIVNISDAPGGGCIVVGTVLMVHADDALVDRENFHVDLQALNPVGRLGAGSFVRCSDTFTLQRYKSMLDVAALRGAREAADVGA